MTTFLQQLVNGLSLGSIYALIALGYTMVYGVLRLINFAHGDVYMVGAYVGYFLSRRLQGKEPSLTSAILVMLGAMIACAIFGLLIERLAYRPVRRASRLTLLITAIGVSLFIENAAQLVFGPDPKFFPSLAPHADFIVAGVRLTSEQITVIGVSFLLMILLRFFIQKTRTGKAMRAVSFNLDAAKLMGISTDRIIAMTFALGSALAAAGGRPDRDADPEDRSADGHPLRAEGLRGRRPRRHRQRSGRGPRRPAHRHFRGHGRRLSLLDLPRRDRVRDPDPRSHPAPSGDPGPRSEGEGVKALLLTVALIGLLLALNALFTGSLVAGVAMPPYILQVLCLAGINIILAVSLNLINGFTGQFSIGHAGFMAIGAYASAYVTVAWGDRIRGGDGLPARVRPRRRPAPDRPGGRSVARGDRRFPRGRARRCACAATTSRS